MLALRFRFPGGLYHATPWGRHVNEGEVEWPPSPWRLCRALLATGWARANWSPEVGDAARRVLHSIGGASATWWVPPGIVAHTRHYMPAFKGSSDKVLDAFIRLPRDQDAVAVLPIDLDAEAIAVLDQVLERLGWLGRADSWVEAGRTDVVPDGGTHLCCASTRVSPGRANAVTGYGLMSAGDYATWRASEIVAREQQVLDEKRAEDERKGRKVREALGKADRARIAGAFPVDPIDTLGWRTSELRKAGWSDPPGTFRMTSWRPQEALAPVRRTSVRPSRDPTPCFALLAVTPDAAEANTLTRLASSIARAEALHRTLVKHAPVPEFTGAGSSGHRHAHILPMSLDGSSPRARLPFAGIDHFLVWAPGGLGADARRALTRELPVYAKDLPKQFVTCVGFASSAAEIAPHCPSTASAPVWISETPFVPPRHLKRAGRNGLTGQIAQDLRDRGLPEPSSVEVEMDGGWVPADAWWDLRGTAEARPAPWWRHFRTMRGPDSPRPPQRVVLGLRITFSGEVTGPICLGYASHFGLGRFVPEQR